MTITRAIPILFALVLAACATLPTRLQQIESRVAASERRYQDALQRGYVWPDKQPAVKIAASKYHRLHASAVKAIDAKLPKDQVEDYIDRCGVGANIYVDAINEAVVPFTANLSSVVCPLSSPQPH